MAMALPDTGLRNRNKPTSPATEMQRIIDQTIGDHRTVIDDVASRLPDGFPEDIATPIFDGIKRCVRKLAAA